MKTARIATLIAALAVLLLLASGPGTRLELWDFRFGIQLMRWGAYAGLAGAGLGVVFLLVPALRRGQAAWLGCAVLLGLGVAYGPWQAQRLARSVPPIHDITTDTLDPPAFVAILPLRADAPNPPEYAGAEIARQQELAYPDLKPLRLEATPEQAFLSAEAAARGQGWDIVAVDPLAGRIEATATTFWFGFKDDVVVRVRPSDGASVVDVRSKSRVGRSDVGANAARIRAYFNELRESAKPGAARQDATPAAPPSAASPARSGFDRVLDWQGIGFRVSSPNGSSLSTLRIQPSGLPGMNEAITREVDGTVVGAAVADLDANGSPELYVFVQSAGSGSYGSLLAFAVNDGKSLSAVLLPDIAEDAKLSEGYQGHDEFAILGNTLERRFPVYRPGDTNAAPSGGTRRVQYRLAKGEAGWLLRLEG